MVANLPYPAQKGYGTWLKEIANTQHVFNSNSRPGRLCYKCMLDQASCLQHMRSQLSKNIHRTTRSVNCEAIMALHEMAANGWRSFLRCGPCIFKHGSREEIQQFQNGMSNIADLVKRLEATYALPMKQVLPLLLLCVRENTMNEVERRTIPR